jgi:hypothetical protein
MTQNNNQVIDLDKLFGLEQQSSIPQPFIQPPEYHSINTHNQPYCYPPSYQYQYPTHIQYYPPQYYQNNIAQKSQEESDIEKLEKIRKLREELEKEIERENNAKKEIEKIEERIQKEPIFKISVEKEEEKTWACSICTFQNKLDRNRCEMCEYSNISLPQVGSDRTLPQASSDRTLPQVSSDRTLPQVSSDRTLPQVSSDRTLPKVNPDIASSIQEKKDNIWECPICTLHNQNNKTKCEACETVNPLIQIKSQSQIKSSSQQKQQSGSKMDILWQKDEYVKDCNKCRSVFTVIRRKHHCRKCGYIFCDDCSSKKIVLKKGHDAERVCNDCYKGSFN